MLLAVPWGMPARLMLPDDLPRAAALSRRIGWNQLEADWSHFLREGAARAVDDGGDTLAATAAVIRHGPGLAWISMVLVRPDRRREGLATALMGWAIETLRGTRCIALDATPAGREVYGRLGFHDVWGFARWTVPPGLAATGPAPRPLVAEDWPAVLALDRQAFGAERAVLLRDFAQRCPEACFVMPGPGGIAGFVLARDGARGPQIGPVVAREDDVARALIAKAAAALPEGAVIDLADARGELGDWLAAAGGAAMRPFTRMVLGADPPGDATMLAAMAGPEFG